MNNNQIKSRLLFFVALLFVYVLLFEFILPVNKVLPKPSLLIESFVVIWIDYNLFQALVITTSIIYISLLTGYFVVSLLASIFVRLAIEFTNSVETLKLFRYFPAFFFAILFAYWFGDSISAEFIFGFVAVTFLLLSKLIEEVKNVKEEYVLIARNLGLKPNEIYSSVVFKSIQPNIIQYLTKVHYLLWILTLIYEFVSMDGGVGTKYRYALSYNDLSAFFSFAILISLLVWFGNFVINLIRKKVYFWET